MLVFTVLLYKSLQSGKFASYIFILYFIHRKTFPNSIYLIFSFFSSIDFLFNFYYFSFALLHLISFAEAQNRNEIFGKEEKHKKMENQKYYGRFGIAFT